MRKTTRVPRSYRAATRTTPDRPEALALMTMIGVLAKRLEEIEPIVTRQCAVCGVAFERVERRRVKMKTGRYLRLIKQVGLEEARRIRAELIEQRRIELRQPTKKGCRPFIVDDVIVRIKPIHVSAFVCGKTIVVPVCSEACKDRQGIMDMEMERCLVQHHNNVQQVDAIRTFLKTKNPDVLRFLPLGLGPVDSSQDSCRR